MAFASCAYADGSQADPEFVADPRLTHGTAQVTFPFRNPLGHSKSFHLPTSSLTLNIDILIIYRRLHKKNEKTSDWVGRVLMSKNKQNLQNSTVREKMAGGWARTLFRAYIKIAPWPWTVVSYPYSLKPSQRDTKELLYTVPSGSSLPATASRTTGSWPMWSVTKMQVSVANHLL